MPKAGQTMEEGIIVSWLKKEGDSVEKGEPIMVIQTDKADLEVEATASGILVKALFEEGDSCPVLQTVAVIGAEGETVDLDALLADEQSKKPQQAKTEEPPKAAAAPASPKADAGGAVGAESVRATPTAKNAAAQTGISLETVQGSGISGRIMRDDVLKAAQTGGRIAASPVARNLASSAGIDLAGVKGTGPNGRIIKRDIEAAAASAPTASAASATQAASAPLDGPRTFELEGMRKAIAGALQLSKQQAPHFYASRSVDMTNAFAFKNYLKETGRKVTVNDLVTRAVVLSLVKLPQINCRIEGDSVTIYPTVNLGIAVGLKEGLVVPVVVNAQQYSMEDLAAESRRVITAAREGKLIGTGRGTFTVTNLGMFGVESFSAIINPPEGAILAVGAAADTIVVKDQTFSIRKVMQLTVSVDHRVIDGVLAAQFLNSVKELLERPESLGAA